MKGSTIFRLDGAKFFSLAKSLSKYYEKNSNLSFVWIDPSPFPSVSILFVSLTEVFFLVNADILFAPYTERVRGTYSLGSLTKQDGSIFLSLYMGESIQEWNKYFFKKLSFIKFT